MIRTCRAGGDIFYFGLFQFIDDCWGEVVRRKSDHCFAFVSQFNDPFMK